MKYVKSIALYVLYPFFMMGIGFYAGMATSRFLDPEAGSRQNLQLFEGLPVATEKPEEQPEHSPEPVLDDRYDYGVVIEGEGETSPENAEQVSFSSEIGRASCRERV